MTPSGRRILLSAKDPLPLWTHLFLTLPPHLPTSLWYIFFHELTVCPSPSISHHPFLANRLPPLPPCIPVSRCIRHQFSSSRIKKKGFTTQHLSPSRFHTHKKTNNLQIQYFSFCRCREAQCLGEKTPQAFKTFIKSLHQYCILSHVHEWKCRFATHLYASKCLPTYVWVTPL